MEGEARQHKASKQGKVSTWRVLKQALALAGKLNVYLYLAAIAAIIVSVIHVAQADLLARLWDSMLATDRPKFKQAAIATLVL